MDVYKIKQVLILNGLMLFCINASFSQTDGKIYSGQAPAKEVDTRSKPIDQFQAKVFKFEKDNITFFADFAGARLNEVTRQNDSTFVLLISAENYPVNPSPWYAFKLVGPANKSLHLVLTYKDARHRYFPKISADGKTWINMDSAAVQLINLGAKKFGIESTAEKAEISLRLKNDTTWIAAQQLETTKDVFNWVDAISKKRRVKQIPVGQSQLGRLMPGFVIGKEQKGKPVIMVISRQHPPEVTGYLAMQSFVNTLLENKKLARKYRRKYVTYIVPLMNPDGVDMGHWRHNAGGIDLNRDWKNFNQPETRQVKDLLENRLESLNSKLIFAIDFHSTWDDIYYTNSKTKESNWPGLIDGMLNKMEQKLNSGKLNVKPSATNETFISKGFFYDRFGAESITYEVGDNTNRNIIDLKGKLAAESLLETLFKINTK